MKELFVNYELALKLKEKGFNEPCLATFHKESHEIIPIYAKFMQQDVIKAPLYQQLVDWFREKHKLHFSVQYSHDHNKYSCEVFDEFHADELRKRNPRSEGRFPYPYKSKCIPHYWNYSTYYEALTKVIEEAIKLI